MKIALNKCYGGFGLSHEAKMLILAKKGINVFPYTCESDYEKNLSTYRRLNQDYSEKKKVRNLLLCFILSDRSKRRLFCKKLLR